MTSSIADIAKVFGENAAVAWDRDGMSIPDDCTDIKLYSWSDIDGAGNNWCDGKLAWRYDGLGSVMVTIPGQSPSMWDRIVLVKDETTPLGCKWLHE